MSNTETASSPSGSLVGLRVVEVGTSVAAPFASQVLGDLGAEVIKVERRQTGDDTRSWAPPSWNDESIVFLNLNRNKKSIALDYKTPAGREVMEHLIQSADVLIQNLRPGAFDKAGFSQERLRELNPRLIYCELTGFGPTGPRAGQPAYDPLLQAYSGIVSMTGEDGREPSRVPVSVLDMGSAMWIVIAVFEALRRRDSTGLGSHIQTSLLQTALTWMSPTLMGCIAGLDAPKRLGSGFSGVVPYGAFPTAEGHIFLSAGNQDIWLRLIEAIDAPDLRDRKGFTSNEERVRNRDLVVDELGRRTRVLTTADLESRLTAAAVPHSPVHTPDEVVVDPQVLALGQIQALPHPSVPDLEVVNLPILIDGSYPQLRMPPPTLGAQTIDILRGLGFDEDRIARLHADGVVDVMLPSPADLSEGGQAETQTDRRKENT